MRVALAVSLIFVCAAASAAEVYKWRDKEGRLHYGDKPKHGAAETVDMAPGSGTGQPSPATAERQARDAECQQKKAQLESWRKAPSLSEVDNLGKQREYSAAEREQFLAMRQKQVDELCARPISPEAAGTFPPPAPPESPPPPAEPAGRSGY